MIDLKYHITSLVAMFLALAIGILVGSTLIGDDVLVQEQKELIDRLELDFQALWEAHQTSQKEISEYKLSSKRYRQFIREVFPILVKDRLNGKNIAIIDIGNAGDLSPLVEGLALAGAQVQSITRLTEELTSDSTKTLANVIDQLGLNQPRKASEIIPQLAQLIGEAIITGQNTFILDLLRGMEMIVAEGEYGLSLDAVVILGGSHNRPLDLSTCFDIPMIKYFKGQGIPVFGAEFSQVPYSYMRGYQAQNISTVDNVDTLLGQIALIFALEGKEGNFGVKSTATSLLPEPE